MTKLEQGSALNAWRLFDMNVVIEWHRLSGDGWRVSSFGWRVSGFEFQVSSVGVGVGRLCRLPCGKPPAFRSCLLIFLRLRLSGIAANNIGKWSESRRLSARVAAKPP